MVQVGQRVQVKDNVPWDYADRVGREGVVTYVGYTYVGVRCDGQTDAPLYYHNELIVLGGKHAGQPHPENFAGRLPTNSRARAAYEAGDRGHGKHADYGDYQMEMDAWEAARDLL